MSLSNLDQFLIFISSRILVIQSRVVLGYLPTIQGTVTTAIHQTISSDVQLNNSFD
jgi:hypothetical protein